LYKARGALKANKKREDFFDGNEIFDLASDNSEAS